MNLLFINLQAPGHVTQGVSIQQGPYGPTTPQIGDVQHPGGDGQPQQGLHGDSGMQSHGGQGGEQASQGHDMFQTL